MDRAKPLLILALAAGATLACAQDTSAKARDVLLRSMQLGRNVPATGIILQRMLGGYETIFQMKLEQANGQVKLTVLSPLSFQGLVSLDDGKQWSTYQPDENRLMVQPSPRLVLGDPKQRMKIAENNYEFRLAKGSFTIAGRNAVQVIATPKSPDIPERRYFFDPERNMLLRLETNTLGKGEARVLYDTAEINFPNDMRQEVFKLTSARPARRVELPAPEKVGSLETAAKQVGFKPVIPAKLPYGFVVQETQLSGQRSERFYAVRVTDGLIAATAYQWDGERHGEGGPFSKEVGSVNVEGIWLLVKGEAPSNVLRGLLRAFARTIEEGPMAHRETFRLAGLLTLEQETPSVDWRGTTP